MGIIALKLEGFLNTQYRSNPRGEKKNYLDKLNLKLLTYVIQRAFMNEFFKAIKKENLGKRRKKLGE